MHVVKWMSHVACFSCCKTQRWSYISPHLLQWNSCGEVEWVGGIYGVWRLHLTCPCLHRNGGEGEISNCWTHFTTTFTTPLAIETTPNVSKDCGIALMGQHGDSHRKQNNTLTRMVRTIDLLLELLYLVYSFSFSVLFLIYIFLCDNSYLSKRIYDNH